MRVSAVLAFTILSCTAAAAASVSATSHIEAVTVFPSGAEITRVARVRIDKGEHTIVFSDLPAQANQSSIRVDGKATGKLEIGSVDTRRLAIPRNDSESAQSERRRIEDDIERLEDEVTILKGRVEAAEAQKALVKNLTNLPNRPPPPSGAVPAQGESWSQVLSLIASSLPDIQRTAVETGVKIRETTRKIEDLQRKLASLAPAREERTEVKVAVSVQSPLEVDIAVRYQVPSASWSPYYDGRLTTGSKTAAPTLALTRRASITQRTGESWEDVLLSLSTTRPTAGSAAPDIRTVTVDFEPEARPRPAAAPAPSLKRSLQQAPDDMRMAAEAPREEAAGAAMLDVSERGAEIETAPFQSIFTVPGRVTIAPTGEAKRVRLQDETIEPQLSARTVAKLDPKAYLYAKFTAPKGSPVLPGEISLFRDGTFVGTGRLPLLVGGEEHELGFGSDDLVRVRHAVAEEKKGETGLISTSRTDERNYKIMVKNLHERALPVTVLDQVPVSRNQDIKVEPTGRSAPTKRDVDDKRGVLAWELKLEPDEERTIEFGYRVVWPSGKNVVYGR